MRWENLILNLSGNGIFVEPFDRRQSKEFVPEISLEVGRQEVDAADAAAARVELVFPTASQHPTTTQICQKIIKHCGCDKLQVT